MFPSFYLLRILEFMTQMKGNCRTNSLLFNKVTKIMQCIFDCINLAYINGTCTGIYTHICRDV